MAAEQVQLDKYAILAQHQNAAKQLAYWKELEAALRQQVIAEFSTQAVDCEGTENYDLNAGYKLKIVRKMNYSVTDFEGMETALIQLEDETGSGLLSDRLVKWKPELSVGEYKKLPDPLRSIVSPFVTMKPGLPTVELAEPKSKEGR